MVSQQAPVSKRRPRMGKPGPARELLEAVAGLYPLWEMARKSGCMRFREHDSVKAAERRVLALIPRNFPLDPELLIAGKFTGKDIEDALRERYKEGPVIHGIF